MYIDRQVKGEGAAFFKNRAHMAFYAACHIIFYVVAARHDDFLDNRKRNQTFPTCFSKHFLKQCRNCWLSINWQSVIAIIISVFFDSLQLTAVV